MLTDHRVSVEIQLRLWLSLLCSTLGYSEFPHPSHVFCALSPWLFAPTFMAEKAPPHRHSEPTPCSRLFSRARGDLLALALQPQKQRLTVPPHLLCLWPCSLSLLALRRNSSVSSKHHLLLCHTRRTWASGPQDGQLRDRELVVLVIGVGSRRSSPTIMPVSAAQKPQSLTSPCRCLLAPLLSHTPTPAPAHKPLPFRSVEPPGASHLFPLLSLTLIMLHFLQAVGPTFFFLLPLRHL